MVEQVYKRDHKGQFAKVNTLLKKIAMAKAQGVKHVEPGPAKKVPPPFSALHNMAAKKLGHDLYMRKKAGEFSNDHAIYLAAAKLAAAYKKKHPTAAAGMSANQIVNAYKRHEYDETGKVVLLGQIIGNVNQLDRTGPGSDWTPDGKPSAPSKPTIDKTKSGLNIASDKFAKPDTLTYTGKVLGGVTGAKVYEDSKGQKWVVKSPKAGSNAYGNKSFMVDIEIAASRIQNKAGLTVPAMHAEEVDGKMAAVSKMYTAPSGGPVKEAFPKGAGLDISTMSPEDLLALQRNQVLDWLLSNADSHSANFLRTDSGIVGIDKGQSFKYFGKDKLDYNQVLVTPLNGNVSVYQSIWKQFAQGYGELFDPNGDELKGTIERIQNIPDDEYRKLLQPYAIKAAASGTLSMPNKPAGAGKAELVQHFLDEAVKRKNSLSKDFGDYYAKVKAEHDANKPQPKAKATGGAKIGVGQPASGSGVKVPVGTQVFSGDVKPGMWLAMKVGDSGKFGPAFQVDKIENGDVYATKPGAATIDMPLSFFESGSFYVAANPLDDTSGPELNKPLKGIDGLKVGDKVQSGYGANFTVTEVNLGGDDPYVGLANEKGDFAGHMYQSDIDHGNKNNNPWSYTGNIYDQGSVDAQDLAGQPITDINHVIPGDKIVFTGTAKPMECEVTNINGLPDSIYAKKTSTGATIKLIKSDFSQGNIKMAYAKADVVDSPKNTKAVAGQAADFNDVVVGDVVNYTTYSGNTLTGKITAVNSPTPDKHTIEIIDPGGSAFAAGAEIFFEADNHFNTGKVKWASPAAAKKKIKIQGEQANIEGVEVGDVLDMFHSDGSGGGTTSQWKVLQTSPNHIGVDVISMKDGSKQVITPADFISGNVFWGDQKATSISAQQWPSYPASDLAMGPFNTQNAPGTTLLNLKLPGWGGYKGDLNVGDEIVAYGTNGEFKKGSVVQSAGGPNECYISWDDDPSGDWLAIYKGGNGGFWGDAEPNAFNSFDSWTLVGKVDGANTSNPAPQKPIGPTPAPAAAVTPTVAPKKGNAGKPATFDALEVGSIYHVPGGKMQKVIAKNDTEFTAQSVSGNTHTYPKEKFDNFAATKGVLLGMPGEDALVAPDFKSVNKGDVFVVPADPFNPNGTSEKYAVTEVAGGKIKYKLVGQVGTSSHTVSQKDWEATALGWKFVPGQSDWEKYCNGIITWEEYQQTSTHQDVVKLHKPEGPAAPGKPSPADAFDAKKAGQKIVITKPPKPWAGIKGDDAVLKDLGQQIYDLKQKGEFEDDHELYKACNRLLNKWKKANPNHPNPPASANSIRMAARRVEFEKTGAVVWETSQQQTAQVVGDVQTAKSAINHVPTGKYAKAHSMGKMPLTAFGDSTKLAGSYQNPVNYGTSSYVTPEMALFGKASNEQTGYTQGERKAIGDYTGSGYTGINAYLRTGGVNYGSASGYATAVKNLDAAIAKSNPVEDWTIVTRGAHGGYDIGINHDTNVGIDEIRAQIGKTVLNKGYSSTSLGSTPAFSHRKYRIIYRIPPGLKGIWVSGDGSGKHLSSCGSSEREFILPRNLKLKVLAANENTDGNAKFDVIVEVVGWEGQGK